MANVPLAMKIKNRQKKCELHNKLHFQDKQRTRRERPNEAMHSIFIPRKPDDMLDYSKQVSGLSRYLSDYDYPYKLEA